MKKLLLTISFLLLLNYSNYASANSRSRIVTDSIYSEVLGTYRAYNIYLPKSFDTDKDKKYPILYLLHGMTDIHDMWTKRGHIKDVADQLTASQHICEMIIVTPNAGGDIYNGVWNGYFNMDGWNYESFFFEEFMPYIEKRYRAIGDKKQRAIAGLSMGGGGATSYAQRHPDKFEAVYAMSALMSSHNGGAAKGSKLQILTESVIEHSCIDYVKETSEAQKEALRSVKWFVDCGDDDFLLAYNIDFTNAMREAKIPFEFRIRDGVHNWEYWHSALYICLPYITRCFTM